MAGRRQGYYDYYNGAKHEAENMRNNRLHPAYPNTYSPLRQTPSAPSLSVTINQNAASSDNYSAPPSEMGDRPPLRPSAPPPPPPPSYNEAAHTIWLDRQLDRFPRRENRGMFRLVLVEAMLAVVILGGGIWCYRDTSDYCPYYSAIWTSLLYLVNAAAGCVAAKLGSINSYIAHLVLSLISIMVCAVSAGFSAQNWTLVGTYRHPRLERGKAFCVLGEADAPLISHIFTNIENFDFKGCLFQLKVGVAVNSIQFVVAAMEVFLNIISATLCCKRTCTRWI